MIVLNVLEALKQKNVCNTLYYGEIDKIMVNTQNYRTKYVMENLYKRRAQQSGMSVSQVKQCFDAKKKPLKK